MCLKGDLHKNTPWVPRMYGLMSFIKFVRFQPLFLQIFLLSLLWLPLCVCWYTWWCPTGLRLHFLLSSDWEISIDLPWSLSTLSSAFSNIFLNLSDLVFLYIGHTLFPCMPCNFGWKLGIFWTLRENSGNHILPLPEFVVAACWISCSLSSGFLNWFFKSLYSLSSVATEVSVQLT